jgi:hypothetical protein
MPDDGASAPGDAGARPTDDAAFARRLRDDAALGRHLEALRRDAYGRAATDALIVPVPDELRRVTGIEDPALPAPLVALLTEEARLVAEGADPTATSSAADGRGSRVEAMGTPDGRRPSAASALPAFTAPPPPHVAATEEELAAAYRQAADIDWETWSGGATDAVRPDVALERVVSPEDFPAQQVACLTAAGYRAEATGDGGIAYEDGDPVAIWTCQTRFPMQLPDPLSDAELAYQHDYVVSFVLPCYAVEGSPYTDAVPGREDFVARARSGAPWFPYPDDADNALLERCPSEPPAWR